MSKLILWGCFLATSVSAFHVNYESSISSKTHRPTCVLKSSFVDSSGGGVVTVDVNEEAPRDMASMEEWAAACGVQRAEGFQLASQDGVDISVMTTQDLTANSPVLFVPNNMILSSTRAQQELGQMQGAEEVLIRTNEAEHIPQFYLMLKLLKEYEMGYQSPWYPWLNSLPRYFTNGAGMTHFCCTFCLPPLVGKLADSERTRFSKFAQAVRKVDTTILSEEVKRNRYAVKWAYQVVYTRSFAVQNDSDVQIVPMADMFNHGTEAEIQLSYDEEGNCCACTTHDVPAGSPLRMSYGDPTNPSYLFARFGFLDETSPATSCKIMIDNPTQQLIDMGYDHSRMLFYKNTGDVSQEVWDVLLYLILENSNPDYQRAFYQAHITGDVETKQAIHQQYYPETLAALQNHIDNFLNQLDTLSAKAVERSQNKKLASKHPRIPLILRHNEFVRNTFLKVRSQL